MTIIPLLVIFSIFAGIIGAFCTAWFAGIMNATDLEYGLQYCFIEWYIWCSFIKSLFFAFIIASVSAYFGYTVEGGSIAVGRASTDSVVSSENGKTNLIIGQSGSGKTVLMKCLVGLLTPEKGEVLYDGRNLINMGKKEKKALRREMGMIFQSAALFDSLSVLENVMFPLDMFSNQTYRERVKRAQFCLDRVNLIDAQKKYPGEISGGMQKRVAIARAIALQPQYLFCDEPNSGLDPKTSLVIDELIHDITTEYNMTTVINTHDMNSVLGIGDSILYIYQGHKEWEGNKDEVFSATNEKLNNFIFASDLLKKVKKEEAKAER